MRAPRHGRRSGLGSLFRSGELPACLLHVGRPHQSLSDQHRVDADSLELERPLELATIVDLDEAVEIELTGLRVEPFKLFRLDRSDDQQYGVRTDSRRLVELVAVDREVLAQDRQV